MINLDLDFRLRAERTPNPQCIKWVIHPPLPTAGRTAYFREAPDAEVSPLVSELFAIPGILEVLVAADFVTVTKSASVEWPALAEPLSSALRAFVAGAGPVFGAAADSLAELSPENPPADEDPVSAQIRELLDQEIRPMVARDGGDLLFVEFREGVVRLVMQGACSGCPSSTQTLKFGIEERLKAAIPAVREVVAL